MYGMVYYDNVKGIEIEGTQSDHVHVYFYEKSDGDVPSGAGITLTREAWIDLRTKVDQHFFAPIISDPLMDVLNNTGVDTLAHKPNTNVKVSMEIAALTAAGIDMEKATRDDVRNVMTAAIIDDISKLHQLVREYGGQIHGDVVKELIRETDVEFVDVFGAVEFAKAIGGYVEDIDIRSNDTVKSLDDTVTLTVFTFETPDAAADAAERRQWAAANEPAES